MKPRTWPDELRITVPLRTVNPLNNRRHWRTVWSLGKAQHRAMALALIGYELPALPVRVVLMRHGRGVLDTDGLAASFKHVRDSVARAYGIDDADPRLMWDYTQERHREYAVVVHITRQTPPSPASQ